MDTHDDLKQQFGTHGNESDSGTNNNSNDNNNNNNNNDNHSINNTKKKNGVNIIGGIDSGGRCTGSDNVNNNNNDNNNDCASDRELLQLRGVVQHQQQQQRQQEEQHNNTNNLQQHEQQPQEPDNSEELNLSNTSSDGASGADIHYQFVRPDRFGPPEIDPSEILYNEELDFLGEGVFGKVFKGVCRQSDVAVKVPTNQNLTPQQVDDFRREVAIMSQIFHPNVVLFMGACTQPGKIKVVTERMTTDLEKLLHSPKGRQIPIFVRMKMARDAAKGMSWLHGINSIIHRDLKPANLLVDNNYKVKVTDFGFSQFLGENTTTKDKFGPRGTAIWMAPEVMSKSEFDKTIDVYSFGIILWEIYTLKEPFVEFTDWTSFYKAVVIEHKRPPIPPECPESLKLLVQDCWQSDRRRRPQFTEIVNRINSVLVDLAVANPLGAKFWKTHFVVPDHDFLEVVPWKDFCSALSAEVGISDCTKFECLQSFLGVFGSAGRVTVHSFNTAINWFGQFFLREKYEGCLYQINRLLMQSWFHGSIDQTEADGRLAGHPIGTFLVRLSRTYPEFPFTLSLTNQRHLRIRKELDPHGDHIYKISNKPASFSNVVDLVDGVKEILGLKESCPRTPARSAYST